MNKLGITILSLAGIGIIGGSAYCLAQQSYNTGRHEAEISFKNENKQDQSLEEAVVSITQELPGGAPVITDIDADQKLISLSGNMPGTTSYRSYNYLYNTKTKSYEIIKYLDSRDEYVNLSYFHTYNGNIYFEGALPYYEENSTHYKSALFVYSNGVTNKFLDIDLKINAIIDKQIVNNNIVIISDLLESTQNLSMIDFDQKTYTSFENNTIVNSLSKSNGKTYSFLENNIFFVNKNTTSNKLELAKIDLTTKEKSTVANISNLDEVLNTDLHDIQSKFYMRDTDIFMQEEDVGIVHIDLATGTKTTLLEDVNNSIAFCIFNFPTKSTTGTRKMVYDTGIDKNSTYLYLANVDENVFKMYSFNNSDKTLTELFTNEQANKTITFMESSKGLYFTGSQNIWYLDNETQTVSIFDRSTTSMSASSYGFNCYGYTELDNGSLFVMSKSIVYHDYENNTWAYTVNCDTVATFLNSETNELNVTKTNAFSMSTCFASATKINDTVYFVYGASANFFVKITPATEDTAMSIYAYTFEESAKTKAELVSANANGVLVKNSVYYTFYSLGATNTNSLTINLVISSYGEFKSIIQDGTNYILTTENGSEYILNTTYLKVYCRKLVLD